MAGFHLLRVHLNLNCSPMEVNVITRFQTVINWGHPLKYYCILGGRWVGSRIGECHRSFKTNLEFGFMLNSTHTYQKSAKKVPGTGLGLDLQVYYYESPYNQGQLTEVPLNFKLIAIKVVGQTIQVCSTTKMSKLQQNGIIKLGLINFLSYTEISP